VNAKILTRNSGFNALLQQSVFGHTGTTSAAKAGIAQQNLGFCQYVCARNAESLPCEWAGAEMGARIREEQLDPNVNRTYRVKMPYRATLHVSPTLTADKYTPAELEDMLQSGASAVIYLDSGTPLVSIPRTTYFKDAFSNLDHRLVGVNQTSTYYEVAYGIGTYLPDRFDGMKVVPDQPQTAAELPTGVVDESTIRANLLVYLDPAIKAGWIRKDKLKAAVDSGSFSVKVDANNPNKVNYRIPLSAVPGLWTNDITILGGS
jgi:phage tail sheath gpL-like